VKEMGWRFSAGLSSFLFGPRADYGI